MKCNDVFITTQIVSRGRRLISACDLKTCASPWHDFYDWLGVKQQDYFFIRNYSKGSFVRVIILPDGICGVFLTLILSTLWLTRCWRSRLLPYYRKIWSISFNPDETNFVRSIEYPTRGYSCFQLSLWHWWESMYKQCLHEGKNCSIVVALCHHAQGSAPRTLNNSPQVCVIVCQPSVSTGFTRSRLLENSDPHTLGDLERSLN